MINLFCLLVVLVNKDLKLEEYSFVILQAATEMLLSGIVGVLGVVATLLVASSKICALIVVYDPG